MRFKHALCKSLLLFLSFLAVDSAQCRSDDFVDLLNPLITKHCLKCHGAENVNGEVDFRPITTATQFLAQPKLINQMIEAIDSNNMPPEDEPPMDEPSRTQLLATLKAMLRQATSGKEQTPQPLRR